MRLMTNASDLQEGREKALAAKSGVSTAARPVARRMAKRRWVSGRLK